MTVINTVMNIISVLFSFILFGYLTYPICPYLPTYLPTSYATTYPMSYYLPHVPYSTPLPVSGEADRKTDQGNPAAEVGAISFDGRHSVTTRWVGG